MGRTWEGGVRGLPDRPVTTLLRAGAGVSPEGRPSASAAQATMLWLSPRHRACDLRQGPRAARSRAPPPRWAGPGLAQAQPSLRTRGPLGACEGPPQVLRETPGHAPPRPKGEQPGAPQTDLGTGSPLGWVQGGGGTQK